MRIALAWAIVLVASISAIDWLTRGEVEGALYLAVQFACHFAFGLFVGWLDWHGRIERARRARRQQESEADPA